MGRPATSCDNCRRSRLGCNIAISPPGEPCYNCFRRGATCTRQSVQVGAQQRHATVHSPAGNAASNVQDDDLLSLTQPCQLQPVTAEPVKSLYLGKDWREAQRRSGPSSDVVQPHSGLCTASNSISKFQQARKLHELLWNVFTSVLEPRIGLWISHASHTCMNPSAAPSTIRIFSLMTRLDGFSLYVQQAEGPQTRTCSLQQGSGTGDHSTEIALMYALYAYSIRWLYVTDGHSNVSFDARRRHLEALKSKLSVDLYYQAKSKVLAAMSRRSYRSVLALFLFATVPSEAHQDDDNIGNMCLETSLSHLHYLNNRWYMSGSSTYPTLNQPQQERHTDSPLSQAPELDDIDLSAFVSMSRVAFWFGVVTDTTRSLFLCRPPILLPGNSGETKVWSDVRAQVQSLGPEFRTLRAQRTPFSNEQVFTILRYAYPLKTLVWAAVTRVQDALFHQASGLSVADAVDAAREASNDFEEIFGQLLCMCQCDFLFLNRDTQICYTLLQIHFQLGHLILVDALPPDFIFIDKYYTPYDLRLCACRSIITALNLALQTQETHNILLLDPHPELMTNAIIRTGSSLLILHRMQKLSIDTTISMFTVVLAALEVLSNISYTASVAIPRLRREIDEAGLDYSTAFKTGELHAAVSVTSDIGQSLFHNDVLRHLEQHVASFSILPGTFTDDYQLHNAQDIFGGLEDLTIFTEGMDTI